MRLAVQANPRANDRLCPTFKYADMHLYMCNSTSNGQQLWEIYADLALLSRLPTSCCLMVQRAADRQMRGLLGLQSTLLRLPTAFVPDFGEDDRVTCSPGRCMIQSLFSLLMRGQDANSHAHCMQGMPRTVAGRHQSFKICDRQQADGCRERSSAELLIHHAHN